MMSRTPSSGNVNDWKPSSRSSSSSHVVSVAPPPHYTELDHVDEHAVENKKQQVNSMPKENNSSPRRRPPSMTTAAVPDDQQRSSGCDGGGDGDDGSSVFEKRSSSVQLNYGHAEVVVVDGDGKGGKDGGKTSPTRPAKAGDFDDEDIEARQSLVETVRSKNDDGQNGSGHGGVAGDDDCCTGAIHDGIDVAAGRVYGRWIGCVEAAQAAVHGFFGRHQSGLHRLLIGTVIIAFYVYLGIAVFYYIRYENVGNGILKILATTGVVMVILLLRFIVKRFGTRLDSALCDPWRHPRFFRLFRYVKWFAVTFTV